MAKRKTKVLAWSDGPTTTTGFGRVAREVLRAVHSTGRYDITSIGINYRGISPEIPDEESEAGDIARREAYDNYELIPAHIGKNGDPFGRQLLLESLANNDFDVVWILQDTFNVVGLAEQIMQLKAEKNFKVIFYFPIDARHIHENYINATRIADAVVVYNEWTKKLLTSMRPKEFGDRLSVIYHGYNPGDFYEISDKEREAFRKSLFNGRVGKDDIVVMRSDSNQQRKDWLKTIQIVGEVAKKNPKVKFYANTTVNNNDFPLFDFARRAGLIPNENFFYMADFTKEYNLTQSGLNKLYNIADIGISTTRGEGCGLFHYEMMALGKPMLIADNSAHEEAIEAEAAMPIYCGKQEDGDFDIDFLEVLPNDLGVMRPVCSATMGADQLMDLVSNLDTKGKELGEKGKEFMKDLTWEKLGEQWIKLFARISAKEKAFVWGRDNKEVTTIKDQIQSQADALTHEYVQGVQQAIQNVRTEWIKKYGFEPPEVSYLMNKGRGI